MSYGPAGTAAAAPAPSTATASSFFPSSAGMPSGADFGAPAPPPSLQPSTSQPSSVSAAELLRENAALKARLQLTEEQRVAQEVLREQLQRFFESVAADERAGQKVLAGGDESAAQNSQLNSGEQQPQPSHPGGAEGEAEEDDGNAAAAQAGTHPSLLHAAVSEVLRHMHAAKQHAEQALADVQRDTVAPLHAQLEAVEQEKNALAARVAELEMSMSNTPAPPLVAELRQLRATEALLRQELRERQDAAVGAVATFHASVEGDVQAARQVPELVARIEALREEVRASRTVQAAQRVLLDEAERRHAVEREIEATYRIEEAAMLRERVAHLEAALAAATERETASRAEKASVEEQLAAAQEAFRQLTQQHSEEQVALAQKRQRAEQDARSNPSSIRGELTKFWYEGRDRIRALERQVQSLHTAEADLRVSQGRVAQLEQGKAGLLGNLATLATEVDRRREEEQRLRAQCAGVEAERDRLLMVVARTTAQVLSEPELRACCTTIREAAARAAAASATVVADPQAMEEALRRAQKLKSEVAQLQRQKDQLQRFVELREDRVRALLEQEALTLAQAAQRSGASGAGGSSSSASSRPTAATPSPASSTSAFSLPQFLEHIRQSANDVFLQSEDIAAARAGVKKATAATQRAPITASSDASASATTASAAAPPGSVTPHRHSFLALQQQFTQSQERLLVSQRELLVARNESRRLQSELNALRSEHAAASTAEATTRQASELANTALTHRTTSLRQELHELRQHYGVAVNMVQTALQGLAHTLQLYQQSETHAERLRELVQEERRDMSDLLRREAASWGTSDGAPNASSASDAAQHAAAAEKITAALRGLERRIAEAVAETSRQAAQDQTGYIGQLVVALQRQEERVQAAKTAFESSAQAQAQRLAERLAAAQQRWESVWKTKALAMEAERRQGILQQHASTVLQHALEQAVPAVASTEGGAWSAAPPQMVESAAHMGETMQALRNFLTQARQRQAQQQRLQELQQLQQQKQQQQQQQAPSAPSTPATAQTPGTAPTSPASPPATTTTTTAPSTAPPAAPPSAFAAPPTTATTQPVAAAPAETPAPPAVPAAATSANASTSSSSASPSAVSAPPQPEGADEHAASDAGAAAAHPPTSPSLPSSMPPIAHAEAATTSDHPSAAAPAPGNEEEEEGEAREASTGPQPDTAEGDTAATTEDALDVVAEPDEKEEEAAAAEEDNAQLEEAEPEDEEAAEAEGEDGEAETPMHDTTDAALEAFAENEEDDTSAPAPPLAPEDDQDQEQEQGPEEHAEEEEEEGAEEEDAEATPELQDDAPEEEAEEAEDGDPDEADEEDPTAAEEEATA